MSNAASDVPTLPMPESQANRKDLLKEAARRAGRYLEGLEGRAVFPVPEALAGLSAFDETIPAGPQDPLETLSLLDGAGSPATVTSPV